MKKKTAENKLTLENNSHSQLQWIQRQQKRTETTSGSRVLNCCRVSLNECHHGTHVNEVLWHLAAAAAAGGRWWHCGSGGSSFFNSMHFDRSSLFALSTVWNRRRNSSTWALYFAFICRKTKCQESHLHKVFWILPHREDNQSMPSWILNTITTNYCHIQCVVTLLRCHHNITQ